MEDRKDHVIGLILGRWRSQPLYAGIGLGVCSVLGEDAKQAVEIPNRLEIGRGWVSQQLRALGSLALLEESSEWRFSIASTFGVEDQRPFVTDDTFTIVADGYSSLMTVIRHSWNGDEDQEILWMIREPPPVDAPLFIEEHAVPSPEKPLFVKSFDGSTKAHG